MQEFLKAQRKYNVEHEILFSENKIIDRLLERDVEMKPVYAELQKKLNESSCEEIMRTVLAVAAFRNPEESRKLRESQRELESLNNLIAKVAGQLEQLLIKRRDVSEESGFDAHEDYHVMSWVEKAGESNYMYQSFLADQLTSLTGQFDLRYWPTTDEVIGSIKSYAREATVDHVDAWTRASISSAKPSKADFLRVLCSAFEDVQSHSIFTFPSDFKLTDESMASLINCTLDLEDEDFVDARYVKRARQRMREQSNKEPMC